MAPWRRRRGRSTNLTEGTAGTHAAGKSDDSIVPSTRANKAATTVAESVEERESPKGTVQLHSLITKYMGETAAKLFAIFDSMRHTRGVYLFDEFDAIGSMRDGSNNVGEIRRVLNSFLQFLEQDESDSLIIAATNLEGSLDDALFRRFDDFIRYQLPGEEELQTLIENRLSAFRIGKRNLDQLAKVAHGLSHAELCRACDQAAKLAVLADRRDIHSDELQKAIQTLRDRKQTVK